MKNEKNLYRTIWLCIGMAFMFFSCSSSNYPVNKMAEKKTFVKVEKQDLTKHKRFQKDKVSSFDYNRLGYYSQQGAYFGYFD